MPASLSPPTPSVFSHLSPTTATIHLSALAHNLSELRRVLSPQCEILAIVKADGYGHGSIVMAETLAQCGVTKFGVATIQEGAVLRDAGIMGTIVVLGGIFSWQLQDLLHYQLTPVISDVGITQALVEILPPHQTPFPVHVKVDTGMRRLGVTPDTLPDLIRSPIFQGPLVLNGLMTHLADADNPDQTLTLHQLEQFEGSAKGLQEKPTLHAANTAGIVSYPQAHYDMVRPGLLLYGYLPSVAAATSWSLQPVLTLSTKVVQIRRVGAGEPLSYNGLYRTTRPSRIGILPIGYAHGYNRRLSNGGYVLVRNRRVPIVGRICMDMTLIDLTDVPEARVEDDVVLLGKQGTEMISAVDLANWQDSIPYEVLCNIGPRVNRVYEPLLPS